MKTLAIVALGCGLLLTGLLLLRPSPAAHAMASPPGPGSGGGRQVAATGAAAAWGWSTAADTRQAAQEAVAQVPPGSGGLTLVFATPSHDPTTLVTTLAERLGPGQAILGWSSPEGVALPDGHHVGPGGVVGQLTVRSPHLRVGVGEGNAGVAGPIAAAARQAYERALDQAGLAGQRPDLILMGVSIGAENEAVAAIDALTGGTVPILGGTAAGIPASDGIDRWFLVSGRQVLTRGLVVAVLASRPTAVWRYEGGFTPLPIQGTITACTPRLITAIDGKPARQVYDRWLGGRLTEAQRTGEDLIRFTGMAPLFRLVGPEGRQHRLSLHVWPSTDPATPDALVAASDVAVGDVVQLSEGRWSTLLNRIGDLPQAVLREHPRVKPLAGFLICCECILRNLPEDQRHHIPRLVAHGLGDGVPWIGAFTWGEQGNFPGAGNHQGNLLTSFLIIPQPTADGP